MRFIYQTLTLFVLSSLPVLFVHASIQESSDELCLAINTPGAYGYNYHLVFCGNRNPFGASNVEDLSLVDSTNANLNTRDYRLNGSFFGGNLKTLGKSREFQCVVVIGKSAFFIWQDWSKESFYLIDCGDGVLLRRDSQGEQGNVLNETLLDVQRKHSLELDHFHLIKKVGGSKDLGVLKGSYIFRDFRWTPREIRLYQRQGQTEY